MELILWRHADAEYFGNDMHRKLTTKGSQQATKVAKWLKSRLSHPWRLICSPAIRARETAIALSPNLEIVESILPGSDSNSLLTAANWPKAKHTVIVVGHQPTIGQTVAHLMGLEENEWIVEKGSIVWLSQDSQLESNTREVVIKVAITPELI
tara:strand:+ start:124 stop:582 length:459 start_codon:yes stop_codon:yes gene_type:complete